MFNQKEDRRKHRRAYFSINDNIIGNFILYGKTEIKFDAPILNISRGGLHFTLDKRQGINPVTGDKLKLTTIKGADSLDHTFDIELEIKWILDHKSLVQVGYGCEFTHVSQQGLKRISEFIDSKYVP